MHLSTLQIALIIIVAGYVVVFVAVMALCRAAKDNDQEPQ